MIPWWTLLIIVPFLFIGGGMVGFIVTRQMIKKYMLKNPPINENVIRTLYQQMGRKPSERQIQNVLHTLSKQAEAPISQKMQQLSQNHHKQRKKR